MNVKKVWATDLRELQDIGARSYLPHYTHLWKPGGAEWYLDRCFGEAALRAELDDENIEYYIAEINGENAGILKLVLHKPLPDSNIENALYLEKIYLTAAYTGKGFGRELMQIAFRRAAELGREMIWLMAMDTSAKPIAAYERAGFRVHSAARLDFELMKPRFRGMTILKKAI